MKTWRLTWEPAPGTRSHADGIRRRHLNFRTWEAAMRYAMKLDEESLLGKPRIDKIAERQLVGSPR